MPATLATELVRITPKMAEELLARNVELNRRLNRALVERYATDMQNGDWQEENGETIKIAPDGTLLDGQHRLSAVVESGRPVRFLVVRNVDPDALATVDAGKSRSFADVLHMRGQENARRVAAAAKYVWHYENGSMLSSGRAVSHALLAKVLEEHPRMPDAVDDVHAYRPSLQPASVLAFVYTLAKEKHPRRAAQWLAMVQEGEGLKKTDAAWHLRERLLHGRSGRGAREQLRIPYVAALMIKSWNATLDNDTVRKLEWTSEGRGAEPFPAVR
ncbi:hypothetical protein [Roseisolibacter agri]|uniref:ParB-like nuclease domain protein n=1 Tax=Roseisolibacter agri TaxID=2014610 RepID=A0AA37V8W9_9BACT|nr:hypothetical protein [Roseisolibacter agri]GLC28271.1 hypothetical protein rosag_47840 [Roseisolibacter agri]